MNQDVTLYQTLRDKDNAGYIEDNGPFKCVHSNAWLGHGYYFWDSHKELGHWWGEVNYGDKYIICEADAVIDDTCWDLHGNGNHRKEFIAICQQMIDAGVSTYSTLLVPQVIELLKVKKLFRYNAIRALGTNSVSGALRDTYIIYRMSFVRKSNTYLDLQPPVQLCLLTKQALSLQNYQIVYPTDYVESYT